MADNAALFKYVTTPGFERVRPSNGENNQQICDENDIEPVWLHTLLHGKAEIQSPGQFWSHACFTYRNFRRKECTGS